MLINDVLEVTEKLFGNWNNSYFLLPLKHDVTVKFLTTHVMAETTLKQKVMDSIDKLPQNATLDEIMEQIYFIHKIEVGLKQSKQGDVVKHEDLLSKIDQW